MKKILLFIAANVGRVHALHDKVTAAYNLWNTVYEAVKPLLPAQAVPAAEAAAEVVATAVAAAEEPAAE